MATLKMCLKWNELANQQSENDELSDHNLVPETSENAFDFLSTWQSKNKQSEV